MYFIKIVLISLVLLVNKNSSAQPHDHTTDQSEVEKCSSDKKVCGTDGKTYSNVCLLQKETGVKLVHDGECTREKNGKKETEYIPDLILKSKIVNTTEESLQKKLVKHFNPLTGKWEYVVEILPTIVITPTFHRLKTPSEIHIPNSDNITDVKTNANHESVDLPSPINASSELVKNIPTYFGITSGGMSPKRKFTNNKYSPGPFIKNKNLSEIIGNRTMNFPRSQVENRTMNETFSSVQKPLPVNPVEALPTVSLMESFNISEIKPPFKGVLLRNDTIHNHTDEGQSTVNQTLPEKPITVVNKLFKLPKKAPKYHKQHQIPKKANSNLRTPFAVKPHALHHYKPYLPVRNVTPHRQSELKFVNHEINVHKSLPKDLLSPHPTSKDNTTHSAPNISQPTRNNLTLALTPKIWEDQKRPVTNVSDKLSGKETVPPISPVKHSAVNISQPITNITGLKGITVKDEHNPVMNTSQPINTSLAKGPVVNPFLPITNVTGLKGIIVKDEHNPVMNTSHPVKEAPESGDHTFGKQNNTPASKKPVEMPKVMPNDNGANTHQIQASFHPGHSKLLQSAVMVPKLHGRIPPKNMPSVIENKEDQTKPNSDTKPKSNTKWGTYYIKLPGNVSDNIDLVIKWEVLQLKTNQPNLTINVSEVIGSKNYTWPKDSKYTDRSTYHKLMSGILKPTSEKIHRMVNDDVWHNTNSRHPQYLVNTKTINDVPINVTKTLEIKTYQLEDEMALKENKKKALFQDLSAYRYVNPKSQVKSKKFGHSLEKHGSYSLDLPSNVAGNFKLIFTWTLKNKLPKTIRSPIDVTEKQVKYDYKWKIGSNNKGEKPIGKEPIKSVKGYKTATPIHTFGERGLLTGRQSPGRRLHDLAPGLRNVHLDIPKTTTKPPLNTTSAPVKTKEITPSNTKFYPGWYHMEMLFNVPDGVGGGCGANNSNCNNQNNYTDDTSKSQMDPTDRFPFNRNILSLLPIDHPSSLNKYAIERVKPLEGKCNCSNDKTN